jgi:hypothetical protein
MFEDVLIESSSQLKKKTGKRGMSWPVSLALHLLVIGGAVGASIWFVEDVPEPPIPVTFYAAAPPPPPPPPHYWVPSIATSGLAFYTASRIPGWQGNVFVGALKSKELARLELRDGKVVHEERLFRNALGERVRTVVEGPDGALYLLTDEEQGRLVRIVPAE